MPRDVSGTYTAPSNSFNPAVDGTDIEPADWNAILIDLVAQGLNVIPASLITGDLKLANFNSGTGASATTFWRGDRTWQPVVVGPNSSTDNAAARFDATTGKIIQDSALIIADTTGALSRTGNGGIPVQGTNTNDSAVSGFIGEYLETIVVTGSAVALTTNTAVDIATVALSAGDWDISCTTYFNPTATTSVTRIGSSLSTTLNTFDNTAGRFGQWAGAAQVDASGFAKSQSVSVYRFSLSASTTIRMVAIATFTASTLSGWGIIRARRVR